MSAGAGDRSRQGDKIAQTCNKGRSQNGYWQDAPGRTGFTAPTGEKHRQPAGSTNGSERPRSTYCEPGRRPGGLGLANEAGPANRHLACPDAERFGLA